MLGFFLRRNDRRNRSPQELAFDASECLKKIKNSHEGFTSSLTFYEIEESMYKELDNSSTGIENKKKFLVSSSRPLIIQTLVIIEHFDLKIIDLTKDIIKKSVEEIELQQKGRR